MNRPCETVVVEYVGKENPFVVNVAKAGKEVANLEITTFYADTLSVKTVGIVVQGAEGYYNEDMNQTTCIKTLPVINNYIYYNADMNEYNGITLNNNGQLIIGIISRDSKGSKDAPAYATALTFTNQIIFRAKVEIYID